MADEYVVIVRLHDGKELTSGPFVQVQGRNLPRAGLDT
jgi:hypothetical protein